MADIGQQQDRDRGNQDASSEGRLALVWKLTQEAWDRAGREIPTYEREQLAVRIVTLEDDDQGPTLFATKG